MLRFSLGFRKYFPVPGLRWWPLEIYCLWVKFQLRRSGAKRTY